MHHSLCIDITHKHHYVCGDCVSYVYVYVMCAVYALCEGVYVIRTCVRCVWVCTHVYSTALTCPLDKQALKSVPTIGHNSHS